MLATGRSAQGVWLDKVLVERNPRLLLWAGSEAFTGSRFKDNEKTA